MVGDHEDPLVGRVRAWDASIILLLALVSPSPLISRLFFFPTSPLVVSVPPGFNLIFSLVECVDPWSHSLPAVISWHLINPFELHAVFPTSTITLHPIHPVVSHLTSLHFTSWDDAQQESVSGRTCQTILRKFIGFSGVIHRERHIVERWEQTLTPVGEVGREGGFVFEKGL